MAEEVAETAEAPLEAPESPAPESPPEEAPESPDVSKELASLREEIRAQREPSQPEADPDGDFIDQLLGPDEDEVPEGDPYAFEPQPEPEEGEEELQQLYSALDARQEERFAQAEAEREFERRSNELNSLAQELPDLKDQKYMGPIQQELNALAERNGNDWIRTDPKLVKALFLSMKAQETADKQRATEQEAKDGATLETGAGPSQSDGDVEGQIADRIVNAGSSKSLFT